MRKTIQIKQAVKQFVLYSMIAAIAVFAFAGVAMAETGAAVEIHQYTHENETLQQEKVEQNGTKDDNGGDKKDVPSCPH